MRDRSIWMPLPVRLPQTPMEPLDESFATCFQPWCLTEARSAFDQIPSPAWQLDPQAPPVGPVWWSCVDWGPSSVSVNRGVLRYHVARLDCEAAFSTATDPQSFCPGLDSLCRLWANRLPWCLPPKSATDLIVAVHNSSTRTTSSSGWISMADTRQLNNAVALPCGAWAL